VHCCLFIAKRFSETVQSTNIKTPQYHTEWTNVEKSSSTPQISSLPSYQPTPWTKAHRRRLESTNSCPRRRFKTSKCQELMVYIYKTSSISPALRLPSTWGTFLRMQSSNRTSHKKITDLRHCFKDAVIELNIHCEAYKPAFESSSIIYSTQISFDHTDWNS